MFFAAFPIVNELADIHYTAFEKTNTNATYPYGAMNFIPALAIHPICQQLYEVCAESVKGSHKISPGSITLDSTFKKKKNSGRKTMERKKEAGGNERNKELQSDYFLLIQELCSKLRYSKVQR
jgi:hypothetical protein